MHCDCDVLCTIIMGSVEEEEEEEEEEEGRMRGGELTVHECVFTYYMFTNIYCGEFSNFNSTVLYFTVLHVYIVLVLYCIVLYYIVLYYTVLYSI